MIRFEIDTRDIIDLQRELEATKDQLRFSISRAIKRTAATLQKQARPALAKGLDLRRQNSLRKRLKTLKPKRKGKGGGDEFDITLWFGLNDLRIGDFKGTPTQTANGVSFKGQDYPGAFIAKAKSGKRTVFKRAGRGRFPISEQTYPIQDRADIILEDEVFPDTAEIFMHHLRVDLSARVKGFGRQSR